MSETLRELLVGISYKDKATPSLIKVDKQIDGIKKGFGEMGKQVSQSSVGIADLGARATKTSKDLVRIDKKHKLWQQTASRMERTLTGNQRESDTLRSKINVLNREINVSTKNLDKNKRIYGESSKEALVYKDHLTDLRLEYNKLNRDLGGLSSARMGQNLTQIGTGMESTGRWMTTRLTLPILGLGIASTKTFIDLEEAFTGVEKTVDGTGAELKSIRKELDYMASNTIPVARKELYGIAENAGQLGIKTKDVTAFTDTIAKLDATTNLTADSASSQLARFANITKMNMDNIDRLGSTVVELGNNTTTTEAEIVSMAMRLGAAGNQVGLTQSEIFGLSAGLSSLGLESEAGGTAVSKLLFDMQKASMTGGEQLGKYAKVANLTGKEFKKAFEDNAADALIKFTQGLGELQKEGGNVIGLLDDMGLGEVRLRDAILRTAGSNGILNKTINMGNIAWEQNIALNDEFAKKAETSASNIQLMKSKAEELGNTFGEHIIPYINEGLDLGTRMINKFGELEPTNQKKVFNGLLGVAIAGPVLKRLGKLTKLIGGLNTTVAAAGGWSPYLAAAGAGLKAFALGPVGIAIGAIAGLSTAAYALYKNWDKIKDIGKTGWDNVKNAFSSDNPTITEMPIDYYRKDVIRDTSNSSNYRNIYGGYRAPINPKIGSNALGTNNWGGGWSELGERGIELIVGRQTRNLAKGSKVVNNRDTREIFNNSKREPTIVQGDTFAPVIHVELKDGDSSEISRIKKEIEKQIEPMLENFFYKMKIKMAFED